MILRITPPTLVAGVGGFWLATGIILIARGDADAGALIAAGLVYEMAAVELALQRSPPRGPRRDIDEPTSAP